MPHARLLSQAPGAWSSTGPVIKASLTAPACQSPSRLAWLQAAAGSHPAAPRSHLPAVVLPHQAVVLLLVHCAQSTWWCPSCCSCCCRCCCCCCYTHSRPCCSWPCRGIAGRCCGCKLASLLLLLQGNSTLGRSALLMCRADVMDLNLAHCTAPGALHYCGLQHHTVDSSITPHNNSRCKAASAGWLIPAADDSTGAMQEGTYAWQRHHQVGVRGVVMSRQGIHVCMRTGL